MRPSQHLAPSLPPLLDLYVVHCIHTTVTELRLSNISGATRNRLLSGLKSAPSSTRKIKRNSETQTIGYQVLKLLSILLCGASVLPLHAEVELIVTHARVWTENPAQKEAEAFAGRRSPHRLPFGTDAENRKAGRSAYARHRPCTGSAWCLASNDAHVHMFWGGQSLASVQLRDVTSRQQFAQRIADFAKTRPAGEWIVVGNWDEEKWTPAELPTHAWIDAVTPDNPVWVNRSDGHMMLANAVAMKLAGVTKETRDVPGGVIVRDKDGNPTGIFKDAAKDLVEKAIPPPTDAQVDAGLLAAQAYAFDNGVTSVQDMGFIGSNAADMQALIVRGYQRLLAQGKLKLRVSARFPLANYSRLSDLGVMTNFGNDTLVIWLPEGLCGWFAWFGHGMVFQIF